MDNNNILYTTEDKYLNIKMFTGYIYNIYFKRNR